MCDYNLQTVRSRPAKVGDKLDHDSTMKLLKTLKVSVGHDSRAAVPGAGDVNHVEVVFFDDPVQMHVNEILPRGRAPVSHQHSLHIRERQRPLQQRDCSSQR